jgi:acyl dehydratase
MALVTKGIAIGAQLEPITKQFTLEMFKSDIATIHNDQAAAEAEGLPGPIAVGPQVAALIFRMVREAFGSGWIEGGKISLTFRRPIPCDAYCTAKGTVTATEPEGERTRVTCDVWVETADGEKTIVGTASGLVGTQQ